MAPRPASSINRTIHWFTLFATLASFFHANNSFSQTKSVATNIQGFGVPFRVNANDKSFIEVQLYVSRDEGKSWQFHSRQSTDKDEFPFFADGDGTYWFALKTLNRDRRLIPDGDIVEPELEIVVDTQKPDLEFRIETDPAGRVACRWRAADTNIRPDSLQILYQSGEAKQIKEDAWQHVDVKLADAQIPETGIYADQVAWWPAPDIREMTVRLQISDTAGNIAQEDRHIILPLVAWRKKSSSTALPLGSAISKNPILASSKIRISSKKLLSKSTSKGSHPPGVVCENGVCRLVKSTEASSKAETQNHPAWELYGKTGPRLRPTFSRPNPQAARSQQATQVNPSEVSQQNHLPRTAKAPQPQVISPALNLVGSDVESVAPPVPDGYVKVVAKAQADQAASNDQSSVNWQSEPYRWGPRNQAAFASTLKPDPSLSPAQSAPSTSVIQQQVKPNPSFGFRRGDQQVSQSSTHFPNNQYQGIAPSVPSEAIRSNPPQLMPQTNPGQAVASTRRQQPLSQPPTDPRSLGPLQNYQKPFFQKSSYVMPRTIAMPMEPVRPREQTVRQSSSSRSALQMISTKRFRLDYAINSIDPSGVAKVDLWMTRDNGRSWELWGSDPDSVSPFPVQVNEEGRYGFRIVIHSREGLTGQGPSRGDQPDMYVHVDSQPPLTKITSVPYGRGNEAGKLVINWSVSDPFLSLRPIRLSYSRGPTGPWTVIDDGLRNVGRYVWKVEPNVSERIFLKIEATDQAGNVGVHQLSQAIDISGLVPRGTIRGVTPVGR